MCKKDDVARRGFVGFLSFWLFRLLWSKGLLSLRAGNGRDLLCDLLPEEAAFFCVLVGGKKLSKTEAWCFSFHGVVFFFISSIRCILLLFSSFSFFLFLKYDITTSRPVLYYLIACMTRHANA